MQSPQALTLSELQQFIQHPQQLVNQPVEYQLAVANYREAPLILLEVLANSAYPEVVQAASMHVNLAGEIGEGWQEMEIILLSYEQVAQRAEHLYDTNIRQRVESEDNIGKMVLIDVATGNYEVHKNGLVAARILNEANPNARLFGIRVGYNVVVSLGGVMERIGE